ncbi:hypothetical protein GGTG_08785 [Gaeumannomyces tritici R3-111a-1]|uniref:Uncharacterized protein n=1 Tax=Gaeumannomyces tritici (strain R3-111a-1) TaxID=644352 RepID=J3P5J6_GAET3|nr:hypothetical protein GGTG_08785 [Gaeumannomyces tritici R3-111a-1]EJT74947.1 hypothetical protein GGTG_08785 [Gaeumannomyces tritici R3-111a-1]
MGGGRRAQWPSVKIRVQHRDTAWQSMVVGDDAGSESVAIKYLAPACGGRAEWDEKGNE